MSTPENRIDDMLVRLQRLPTASRPPNLFDTSNSVKLRKRPQDLQIKPNDKHDKHDERLREIMKNSGKLKLRGQVFHTTLNEMEHIEELGNGTCGHVVKMRHLLSQEVIAVKQMRRTGNMEENKRIVMDIEVVIKSHGCPYIVQCLGCFITEVEVWICMELMATCFDKLLKRLKKPIPERVLGKVTVATIKALSYLKDKHGIIHRDVKPSNILLDERGNVKLCDFGISGRLVDSMAATKSAGCTAYLAPERIEVDPKNPDYDIRADVWSLGITLVELATGTFPYKDCKTDFEVLAKVIDTDPPILPSDQNFSAEFRQFVKACLIKDKHERPKYVKLKEEPFYKTYEAASDVNVGEWFVNAMRAADEEAKRHTEAPIANEKPSEPIKQLQQSLIPKFAHPRHTRQHSEPPRSSSAVTSPTLLANLANGEAQRGADPAQGAIRTHTANMTTHQSRIAMFQKGTCCDRPVMRTYSPLVQRRAEMFEQHVRERWHSPPVASPLRALGSHQTYPNFAYSTGNTSPIVLQRFYHQQKQYQEKKEAEEQARTEHGLGKKKLSSYIKLQLNGDRSGRSSRHQSPEPPPRVSRGQIESPLALRRNCFEVNSTAIASPAISRRYISPAPPMPPPRRIESTSVPGSPQHVRARYHYTPEPQRRLYSKNEPS